MTDNGSFTQSVFWLDLGICDFNQTLIIQKQLHERRINNNIPDTLIFVEHPPVITFGKSGNNRNLLAPIEKLKKQRIAIYHIERGGDVTFHGPGQLVGYPIFHIKESFAGIKPMIEKLQSAIIMMLRDFGIYAQVKSKFIGVWVGDDKIASIGIAVKKWVSFHGFALNVNTDLSYFDLIIPCGLKAIKMTSMAKILKQKIPLTEVKNRLILNLEKVWQKKFQRKSLAELTA